MSVLYSIRHLFWTSPSRTRRKSKLRSFNRGVHADIFIRRFSKMHILVYKLYVPSYISINEWNINVLVFKGQSKRNQYVKTSGLISRYCIFQKKKSWHFLRQFISDLDFVCCKYGQWWKTNFKWILQSLLIVLWLAKCIERNIWI